MDLRTAESAANALKGGGIVAIRTDTVYGLLASVNRLDALARLAKLKGRTAGKPFLLLAADWIGVRSVTSSLPPVARALGARYWPGPLTLVLPAADGLPPEITDAGRTVAVRVPGRQLLRAVVSATRCAVAAPSANLPGGDPARTADDVRRDFGEDVDLLLDAEESTASRPSTIVNCIGPLAEVLREGPVTPTPGELKIG